MLVLPLDHVIHDINNGLSGAGTYVNLSRLTRAAAYGKTPCYHQYAYMVLRTTVRTYFVFARITTGLFLLRLILIVS